MASKRNRVENSRLNAFLEIRLNSMSGKMYEVYNKPVAKDSTAKKKDITLVPVELWIYWLNTNLSYSLSLGDWGRYVVILQEKFLLLHWMRNVMRIFNLQITERIRSKSQVPRESIVDNMAIKGPQEKKWKKGGNLKYRRESKHTLKLKDNFKATRDCITRSCECPR